MSTPEHDPFRFTTLAHADHDYLSPLSRTRAAGLLRGLTQGLSASDLILDAGCGKAALLRDALSISPARGLGIDLNPAFLDEARAAFPDASRLALVKRPVLEQPRPPAGYAAMLCVGSSQVFGSFDDCLRIAFDWLKPGGRLLLGDCYWKKRPAPEFLAALGGGEDDFGTHEQNAARARAHGYRLLQAAICGEEEWDAYEDGYYNAMMRYLARHPQAPEHEAFAERMRRWRQIYLNWGRDTLGFGCYLLERP
ncbi:class I SAM-dependent methyltransferase [Chromobacterium paludis]|uniref:Class I SAM-dependent methyltransferase n=1 Tax=Chromobacterium paludis TaxID=2605945 RepID=A0A5C1DLZ2_9NEIS|nr:class I SAM-dependent methyltransferase [Chromobacterium paludis]QEL56828.1 class I SAM-dependent methyltransferase [Chromobacterium paludis]